MEEIRKCPCNFERWSVACDLSRGWPAARNQLSMWMGYQSRQGWHHMMLTALIHSSSLRELTEISSSFFSKPLFMKKGGGVKGGLQWWVQMVMIKYCVHVFASCILMFTTKTHDNVNSLKVNNLIEYMYFSEIAVIMFSRIGEFSQLLV